MTAIKTYSMEEIRQASAAAGNHFFSHDTMKFFRSRTLPKVYQGTGGIYFVTSEQFVPSSGIPDARKFTVRRFRPEEDADVRTAGEFYQLSRREATTTAARLAAGQEVK